MVVVVEVVWHLYFYTIYIYKTFWLWTKFHSHLLWSNTQSSSSAFKSECLMTTTKKVYIYRKNTMRTLLYLATFCVMLLRLRLSTFYLRPHKCWLWIKFSCFVYIYFFQNFFCTFFFHFIALNPVVCGYSKQIFLLLFVFMALNFYVFFYYFLSTTLFFNFFSCITSPKAFGIYFAWVNVGGHKSISFFKQFFKIIFWY